MPMQYGGDAMARTYTASEAARALGISLDTLRRWDRQGRIRVQRDAANRRVVTARGVERLRGDDCRNLSARNPLEGVVRGGKNDGLLAQTELHVVQAGRVGPEVPPQAADVYAAASPKFTQLLYRDGFLLTPVVFATNKLIILVPKSNPASIKTAYDLRRDGLKLVIGDRTVPIGTYTRQILDTLGITTDVMKNVVSQETDVKSIVTKVALGEADAGLVYRTDAKPVAPRTKSLALPDWAQPAIRYELAVVKTSSHLIAARAFVKQLVSKRARLLLAQAGFGLLKKKK